MEGGGIAHRTRDSQYKDPREGAAQASARELVPAQEKPLGQALVPVPVPVQAMAMASLKVPVLDPEQAAASNCNLRDRDRRNSAQVVTVRASATERVLAKAQGRARVEDTNQPRDTRWRCCPGPRC